MTVLQVLKKARAKIRKGWCKGANARNASGLAVRPHGRTAVQWCSVGALLAVAHGRPEYPIARALLPRGLVPFNDSPMTTKTAVLAVFADAIKKASKVRK